MLIKLENVTKIIRGKTVLSEINAELTSGKVFGFVGSNGSGKTMLFRAVSGLIRPTDGKITVDGKIMGKDIKLLPSLGMVLENADLYSGMTGMENLKTLAAINKKISGDEIKEAIEKVGLDPDDNKKYKKYSLGMKQRLKLAQAFMEKPEVLILDEPTNGLDENGVEIFRNIVLDEKKRGALIMLSSHNRADIDILCDEVFLMFDGKLRKEVQL